MGRLYFQTACILSTALIDPTWIRRLGLVGKRVLIEKTVGFGIRAGRINPRLFRIRNKVPLQDALLPF